MIKTVKTYENAIDRIALYLDWSDEYMLECITETDKEDKKELRMLADAYNERAVACADFCDYLFGLEYGSTLKNARGMLEDARAMEVAQ